MRDPSANPQSLGQEPEASLRRMCLQIRNSILNGGELDLERIPALSLLREHALLLMKLSVNRPFTASITLALPLISSGGNVLSRTIGSAAAVKFDAVARPTNWSMSAALPERSSANRSPAVRPNCPN